jgi:hypothetical protein
MRVVPYGTTPAFFQAGPKRREDGVVLLGLQVVRIVLQVLEHLNPFFQRAAAVFACRRERIGLGVAGFVISLVAASGAKTASSLASAASRSCSSAATAGKAAPGDN